MKYYISDLASVDRRTTLSNLENAIHQNINGLEDKVKEFFSLFSFSSLNPFLMAENLALWGKMYALLFLYKSQMHRKQIFTMPMPMPH